MPVIPALGSRGRDCGTQARLATEGDTVGVREALQAIEKSDVVVMLGYV